MKAMILAAGRGTRLQPLTHSAPKALMSVHGKTLLEIQIRTLIHAGVREIIINVHHFPKQIIDFLKLNQYFGIRIEVSHEENLLDTGGGLKKAGWFFKDGKPFLLINVDVLHKLNLVGFMDYHKKTKALATLAVRTRKSNRLLLFNHNLELCGWKNIQENRSIITRQGGPAYRELAFSGLHIIDPKLISLMGSESRFSIIDTYLHLAKNHTIKAMVHDTTPWIDCGKPANLKLANEDQAYRIHTFDPGK